MAEEAQIDWKTLPEYMAMDRDQQRQLIWETKTAVMRQIAQSDLDRAECIAGLFDFGNKAGQQQFYNLKGFLKESAQEVLFPGWKAQQVAAWVMKKHLCPEKLPNAALSK